MRTIPAEDLTNGFFVSCFVRKSPVQGEKRTLEESGNLETANSKNTAAKKKKKNNKKKKVAVTA